MPFGLGDGNGRRDRPIRTGRRDKPIIQLPSVALRAAVVFGLVLVLFAVILFRLWFLQILSGQQFVAQANDNRLRSVKVVAPRGTITDRHGEVIVANRPGLAVGIRLMDVPPGRLDAEVVELARVLHRNPQKMRKDIVAHLQPSWPAGVPRSWKSVTEGKVVSLDLVVVKEDVSRKVLSYLLEHAQSFPGVEIQKNYLRDYPHGELAAHVLGNLGEVNAEQLKSVRFKGYSPGDVVGQSGLEWTYDRWLRGRDGVAKVEVDAFGRPKGHDPVPGGRLPEPGDTLVTTLDAGVQEAAEEALRYGIHLAQTNGSPAANGGAAVVLDADNGEVLAMASYPSFDPAEWVGGISTRDYRKYTKKSANTPLLNRPIQETKAVGSTFKPVDAVAALEEGVITAGTSFFCPGSYVAPNTLDNLKFNCWARDGHGTLDLVEAITQSCDVYFYNVGYLFYQRKGTELADWAVRMGFGKPTGIDIPGEVAGRVPTPDWKESYYESEIDKIWKPGDSINMAVGQGDMEATPLQLAVSYAAVANGGKLVVPHLGLRVVDPQGQTVRTLGGTGKTRKVDISRTTLDTVRRGIVDAANSSSGTSSGVFGGYQVTVAGKTGTAEVYDAGTMHYVDYAWYASYAPADDPRYVVVVMIEKGGHGGATAAPAARIVYDSIFDLKSDRSEGAVRSD